MAGKTADTEGLDLWRAIERALVAGEPLPPRVQDQLCGLAEEICRLIDNPNLSPPDAAEAAAKFAGLTGLEVEAYRNARRGRRAAELFEIEKGLIRQTGRGTFTPAGKTYAIDAANAIGARFGIGGRMVQEWAKRLPREVKRMFKATRK